MDWGSAADWASAAGSFAAVVTALHLARASEKIKLKAWMGHRVMFSGYGHPSEEHIIVSVTNVGVRPTVVSNIGLVSGLFKKKYAVLMVGTNQYSSQMPSPVSDGQELKWAIPLDKEKTWIKEMCSGFTPSYIAVKTLRIQIYTSHGHVHKFKPEKGLTDLLIKQLKVANNSFKVDGVPPPP